VVGSSQYYLANIREFKKPKGISTFPDGGMPKEIRHLFGLFKTDSFTNSTILVTKMGDVVGWPSKYSTRMDHSSSYIAIGIMNVTQPDSASGIYLYNLKNEKFEKFSKTGALPALSKNGKLLAYCIHNKLIVNDFLSKNTLFSYLLNFEPVFVTWKSDDEIYIFFPNPFRVKILNISTGRIIDSSTRYLKNFDQELGIDEINNHYNDSAKDFKVILDKNP